MLLRHGKRTQKCRTVIICISKWSCSMNGLPPCHLSCMLVRRCGCAGGMGVTHFLRSKVSLCAEQFVLGFETAISCFLLFGEFPEIRVLAGTLKDAEIGMGVQTGKVWWSVWGGSSVQQSSIWGLLGDKAHQIWKGGDWGWARLYFLLLVRVQDFAVLKSGGVTLGARTI